MDICYQTSFTLTNHTHQSGRLACETSLSTPELSHALASFPVSLVESLAPADREHAHFTTWLWCRGGCPRGVTVKAGLWTVDWTMDWTMD